MTSGDASFVSVFTGIGGLDKWLHDNGWNCDGMVEIDPHCQATLSRHFPTVQIKGDICDVHASDFTRTPTLLIGGFPCTNTSVGAPSRAGLAGSQSGLFFEQLRLLDEFSRLIDDLGYPEWVVIENPEGVLTSNGGRDWGVVTDALGKRGYGWAYRVVDGRYLGTPQQRRRIILVGHRDGDPRPAGQVLGLLEAGGSASPALGVKQGGRQGARSPLVGSAAGTLDDGTMIFRKSARPRAALSAGGYETWVPAERSNTLTVFDGGGPTRQTHLIVHPDGRVRTLTLTEWERLNGFPDDWTAGAPASARYSMLGNCIHKGMGDWVGSRLTRTYLQLQLTGAV